MSRRVSERVKERNKVSLSDTEKVNPCRLMAVECCLVLLCDSTAVDVDTQCKPAQS